MSVRYERGQVAYADLNPVVGHEQAGERPYLILSENGFNAASRTIIGMPLTSRQPKAPYPFSFQLAPFLSDGSVSWVKVSQVRTLSVERLTNVIGRAASEDVEKCIDALIHVLGRRRRRGQADNDY